MKSNVFWTLLGIIVVAWLGALGWVYASKVSLYTEEADRLRSLVRNIEDFADEKPENLPTDELLAARRGYYDTWQENCQAATELYEERDRLFEDLHGRTTLADWTAYYEDSFDTLEADYRALHDLDDAAKLKFRRFKDQSDSEALAEYQKYWNMTEALLRGVMETGGTIDSYSKKKVDRGDELQEFRRMRVRLLARVPANRLNGFLGGILQHEFINFEVQEFSVGKSKNSLIYDLVEEVDKGEEPSAEPDVLVHLLVDALDWNPQDSTEKGA